MKRRYAVSAALMAAVLIALLFAWREQKLAHVAFFRRFAAERIERTLKEELAASAQHPGSSGNPGQPLRTGSDTDSSDTSEKTAQPPAVHLSRRSLIANNPALRAAYLKAYGDGLDDTYGLIFAALRLTPDQIARVKALMVAEEENDMDVVAAAEANGLNRSDPGVQAMESEFDDPADKQIKTVLGPDGWKAFHQYDHENDVQPVVAQISSIAYSAAVPLTTDQGMQLMKTLTAASDQSRPGVPEEGTINWEKASTLARSFLTPDQLGGLQAVGADQQAQQQLQNYLKTSSK